MSYMTLTDDNDLKIFSAAEWIDCFSTNDLLKNQLEHWVEDRCKQESTGEQLYL